MNEAEVVHQQASLADHEVVVFGDGEVIDFLRRAWLDRFDGDDAADHAEAIAGLQVTRHRPARGGLPESVDAGGDGVAGDSVAAFVLRVVRFDRDGRYVAIQEGDAWDFVGDCRRGGDDAVFLCGSVMWCGDWGRRRG